MMWRRGDMKRIVRPTTGPGEWASFLAQPELHWKKGASAMSLAGSWEAAAPSFPREVAASLDDAGVSDLAGLRLVVAIPEFKIPLPGGSRSSQTDLMVLASNAVGTVAIAVEGKVEEPFGPTVGEKRRDSSNGQAERLTFLERTLGLQEPCAESIRYQLLHRAASALLFAQEVHAGSAVLLVHSFSAKGSWFGDFAAFARILGGEATTDKIVRSTARAPLPFFLGWVSGDRRFAEMDIPAVPCR
jgi:hypothetical protein